MEHKGEKGLFLNWKTLTVVIGMLGSIATGYYQVRTAVNATIVLAERQKKYNTRYWEFKEWVETSIWEMKARVSDIEKEYLEEKVELENRLTKMEKDIEYLQKPNSDEN